MPECLSAANNQAKSKSLHHLMKEGVATLQQYGTAEPACDIRAAVASTAHGHGPGRMLEQFRTQAQRSKRRQSRRHRTKDV
jgi:hypothetical protein